MPSPESFRGCQGLSGLQTRWAHRLKVYVPSHAQYFNSLLGSALTESPEPVQRLVQVSEDSGADYYRNNVDFVAHHRDERGNAKQDCEPIDRAGCGKENMERRTKPQG